MFELFGFRVERKTKPWPDFDVEVLEAPAVREVDDVAMSRWAG